MGSVNSRDKRVDASIVTRDRSAFDELERYRGALEASAGVVLKWDSKPERKQNYVSVEQLLIDPMNRETWPECWRWLRENLERLDRACRSLA